MAKAPRLGRAKTRLRESMRDEDVETLAAAFFIDTLRAVRGLDLKIIIAFAPLGGSEELRQLACDEQGAEWVPQSDGDLGERLESAIRSAEADGCRPIVCIGTDSPTVPPAQIRGAFDRLSSGSCDVVFGPADDGGYYLVGMNRFSSGLFDRVEWSTDVVLDQTVTNARESALRVELMDSWYDVDTVEDLRRLIADVSNRPDIAPATFKWLAERKLIQIGSENTSHQAAGD